MESVAVIDVAVFSISLTGGTDKGVASIMENKRNGIYTINLCDSSNIK